MCIFCMHLYACSMCVPGTNKGQKLVLDPLEEELKMIGCCHEGAGNWTWILCKKKCSYQVSHLSGHLSVPINYSQIVEEMKTESSQPSLVLTGLVNNVS